MFFLISLLLYINSIFLTVPLETSIGIDKETILEEIKEDITGNGLQETIQLHGKRLTEKSDYLQDITFSISSPLTKTWKKSLVKGYDPKLKLLHLTNNQQKDFFYEVALNEERTTHAYELFHLNQGKLFNIPLPKQENVQVQLEDNFFVSVKLPLQKKKDYIEIDAFKKELIKKGLYNEDGKLVKLTTIIPEDIGFIKPVFLTEQNKYGLKTRQDVKGINKNYNLGSIQTIWHMQDDEWIILETKWQAQK